MKKTFLLLSVFAILCVFSQSCKKTKTAPKVINVSGLFSLTGNWSSLGINSQSALQLAVSDINTYLNNKDAGFTMSVSFYDTKLDHDIAKQAFSTVTAGSTRFIIGPQSSSELADIVPLSEAAHTIVISQGSTAGSLAIADDGVFRFCPSDKAEGAAIANTIYKDGIKALAIVGRNDPGNRGLLTATAEAYRKMGGIANNEHDYSPTTSNFAYIIPYLKTVVEGYKAQYGQEHTGVYLASFDEGAELMALASHDSLLSNIRWYGGDGIVLSTAITANNEAAAFAMKTGFFAPTFGLPVSLQNRWQPVASRIKAGTGIEPDAFALAAYDAMWVIALTLEATHGHTDNYAELKRVFAEQSNAYTGITGSTALNSFGDRASGAFDYWGISLAGSSYNWIKTGTSE